MILMNSLINFRVNNRIIQNLRKAKVDLESQIDQLTEEIKQKDKSIEEKEENLIEKEKEIEEKEKKLGDRQDLIGVKEQELKDKLMNISKENIQIKHKWELIVRTFDTLSFKILL